MGLVLAFAEIAGAVLFLTAAITGANFSQVLSGQALVAYRRQEQAGASQANTTSTSSAGSSSPGVSVAPGKGGGVNPFAKATGLNPERVDQGKDYSMNPGSPILAPYESQFVGIVPNWYAGQPYIAFKILSGPYAGKAYYLAEQIIPEHFSIGQTIQAGTQIATYASSGTGIEFGLANPSNPLETLARATTGYAEGEATSAGQEWTNILKALGAPV